MKSVETEIRNNFLTEDVFLKIYMKNWKFSYEIGKNRKLEKL